MAYQINRSNIPSPSVRPVWHQRLAGWGRMTRRRLRRAWWSWVEKWPFSLVTMFVKALPLLVLWLTLPAFVWLLTFGVQAAVPLMWDAEVLPEPVDLVFTDTQGAALTLHTAYPRRVLADPDALQSSLSLWLSPYQSTGSMTLVARIYYASVSVEGDSLTLTDKQGHPVIQPARLVAPGDGITNAARFYLYPRRVDLWVDKAVTLHIRLADQVGNPLQPESYPIKITIERGWLALLSRVARLGASATLLAALATAAVGFGVQQWIKLAEEERSNRRARNKAFEEINTLPGLLRRDFSEGARRYLEFLERREAVWNESRVRDYLRDTWQKVEPVELRHVVDLVQVSRDEGRLLRKAEDLGLSETAAALEWGYKRLDEDWRLKVREPLLNLSRRPEYSPFVTSTIIQNIQDKPWHAILQRWPHISLWRDAPLLVDIEIERALRFLRLQGCPFGLTQAETDILLLACRVDLPRLRDLRATRSAMVIGAAGSGKTATALLLVYDSLRSHDRFPVYYPVELVATKLSAQLDGVARALSKTLLNYLAVRPREFLKRDVAGRAVIAHLFGRYIGTGNYLALLLHEAGLPEVGDGLEMLEGIERLAKDASFTTSLNDSEVLVRMSEAYPQGFQHALVLMDVQQHGSNGAVVTAEFVDTLLDLRNRLARVGVVVKIFLPDLFQGLLPEAGVQPSVRLEWGDEELLELLKNRLAKFGDDSLAAWCDPEARSRSPDERLVNAAQGTPGGLIEKGNELLRRIGQTQRLLTEEDLSEILGPLPE